MRVGLDDRRRMTTAAFHGFTGVLLQPDDEGYENARRVWNGAIDRCPAFIARCRTAADVASAIRFGTWHGLPIAVRGGGHSIPASSPGGPRRELRPRQCSRSLTAPLVGTRYVGRSKVGLRRSGSGAGLVLHQGRGSRRVDRPAEGACSRSGPSGTRAPRSPIPS
jgi:hypothetical protein